ncbi:flagellar type III secretion system pore protein FliP [Colwellia sp. MEBiC06753]
MKKLISSIFFLCLILLPSQVSAYEYSVESISALTDSLAPELKIVAVLTSLSLLPAILIATTAFTRIVIVLSMLRHALGLQQTPPNMVLITLALFLTLFVMEPVITQINTNAFSLYMNETINLSEALSRSLGALRGFMISQTRESDVAAVLNMANQPIPNSVDEIKTLHLIPAFLLSELTVAFKIAFVIFIPFLLIDLVVASTLMSLGMIMVPPITIALPLKIMLFVLVDGWALLTQSLITSFT